MKSLSCLFIIACVCFAAEKVVMDQSITIRLVPGHYDTLWIDGVKSAVYVAAKKDTVVPVMVTSKEYAVTDTVLGTDSTWNFFVYMERKKGLLTRPLDTFKIKRMQPGSTVRNKLMIFN